jgi:hypothetical protein
MGEMLQIILVVMLIVVIVFFIILGIQVYFLIQDARKTMAKANQVLDNTSSITDSISEPLAAISGIAGTVSTGAILTKVLKIAVRAISKTDDRKKEEE